MGNEMQQDYSDFDEGYYLVRMDGSLEQCSDEDLTILYFDKKSFYAVGSPVPVDMEDLSDAPPVKISLAGLYNQITNATALPKP